MSSVKFLHARKKTRDELRLPQQHFVAMDDWIKKIGNDAYVAWLTFYTWADRSKEDREADAIPNSMNKIAKRLGVGKEKFYQKIIRPLWNYGFIDLHEIEIKSNLKENPVNIIVYEYPQNSPDLATKPLEIVRNYDTDYKPAERKEKSAQAKIPSSKIEPEEKSVPSSKIEPDSSSIFEPDSSSKIEPNNVKENNVLKHNVLINNNVVDDLLNQYEIKVNKTTLSKWLSLADQETILEVVSTAIKKPDCKNVVGYVTRILTNGYTRPIPGSSSTTSKQKHRELPDYIVNQNNQATAAVINPDQQREVLDLFLKLGEITKEEYDQKCKELD
ncbi:hypothetical protein [Robertmurraya sp.]|uniref:hypothetical protein n=1 Tax=Robertmurraya sp. TaxID=2837525 RepID=UPI0037048AEA